MAAGFVIGVDVDPIDCALGQLVDFGSDGFRRGHRRNDDIEPLLMGNAGHLDNASVVFHSIGERVTKIVAQPLADSVPVQPEAWNLKRVVAIYNFGSQSGFSCSGTAEQPNNFFA